MGGEQEPCGAYDNGRNDSKKNQRPRFNEKNFLRPNTDRFRFRCSGA
jgi:hypothetical protein